MKLYLACPINHYKFPNLGKFMASKMALFGSTYLCEQFFSKMVSGSLLIDQ